MKILWIFLFTVSLFAQTPDTLGTTSIGASALGIGADAIRFNLYTAASSGNLVGGAIYQATSAPLTTSGKLYIYLDDGDDSPGTGDALIAVSSEGTATDQGWITVTFSSGEIIKDSSYYIGLGVKTGTNNWGYRHATSGTEWRDASINTYASPPAAMDGYTLSTAVRTASWYVTYTLPAAETTTSGKFKGSSGWSGRFKGF